MCKKSFNSKDENMREINEISKKRVISRRFGRYLIAFTEIRQQIDWATGELYAGMKNAALTGLYQAYVRFKKICSIYPQEGRENNYDELVELAKREYVPALKLVYCNVR